MSGAATAAVYLTCATLRRVLLSSDAARSPALVASNPGLTGRPLGGVDQTAVQRGPMLYVSTRGASLALAVRPETIRSWLADGTLSGVRLTRVIASHERQRRGGTPHWRVSVDSIERLLASAAGGGPAPIAVRRRLRQLGKPQP